MGGSHVRNSPAPRAANLNLFGLAPLPGPGGGAPGGDTPGAAVVREPRLPATASTRTSPSRPPAGASASGARPTPMATRPPSARPAAAQDARRHHAHAAADRAGPGALRRPGQRSRAPGGPALREADASQQEAPALHPARPQGHLHPLGAARPLAGYLERPHSPQGAQARRLRAARDAHGRRRQYRHRGQLSITIVR